MNINKMHVEKLSINRIIEIFWFVFLIALCVFPSVMAVLHAPIQPDSAWYLSYIERMNDGMIPYVDLDLYYTPIVFYLSLFLKNIFSIGISYEFFMTVHFILQFCTAYFVYKITVQLINEKDFAFYAAVLFILASHWNEGNAFLLETPSVLFGLTAIFLTIKYHNKKLVFFGIGFLVAFSFLSKQYGLGFLGLVVYLLFYNNKKWSQLLYLLFGFLMPILVSVLIWGDAFSSVISGSYGIERTFLQALYAILDRGWYFLIRIFPVLIIGILYLPNVLNKSTKYEIRDITMLLFGVLGFMLQFYFVSFSHYYLYLIPFAAILSFLLLNRIKKGKRVYLVFLILTVLLSIYSTYHNRVYKIYFKHREVKENQYILAKEILKRVDRSKTLYILDIGLMAEYYLTNMLPPNLKTIGYSLGVGISEEMYLNQINNATYVLKFTKEYPDFNLNSAEVIDTLKQREIIGINKDVILYKKNN